MNFVFLFINVIIDNAALTWNSVLIRQTVSRSEIPKVRYIGIFELYISPIPVSEHIPVYRIYPIYRFSPTQVKSAWEWDILTYSHTVLKKSLKKFLSVVREYFFCIFLKIMNNVLCNYAKRLKICVHCIDKSVISD